jgi:hypothetical protein
MTKFQWTPKVQHVETTTSSGHKITVSFKQPLTYSEAKAELDKLFGADRNFLNISVTPSL